jgi:hypothetical protein
MPVLKSNERLPWNLSPSHPWELLLFKMWMKECGSFQLLLAAEPFAMLDAFGLPAYELHNFRKELQLIKAKTLSETRQRHRLQNITLNKTNALIYAKTINDPRVEKVGLIPNLAGYRILRLSKPAEQPYYRMFSNLPCHWVGTYSPILNTDLNKIHSPEMFLDL